MYGSISWGALIALVVFAILWEGYFNVHNRAPRVPRWLRPRSKQKGLIPPGVSRRGRAPR